jgi:hypothetical protein
MYQLSTSLFFHFYFLLHLSSLLLPRAIPFVISHIILLLIFFLPSLPRPILLLVTRFLRQARLLKRVGGLKLENENGN